MMYRNTVYYKVVCYVFGICGLVVLSRITQNWAVAGLAAFGIWCALRHNPGPMLAVYLLLAFLPMVNGMILPRFGHFAIIARTSTLAMTAALILTSDGRSGRNQLPLGAMYFYLLAAALSSIEGYCPIISYLKILNFFLFVTGIYVGTKNLNRCHKDIKQIRYVFLAIITIIVYGSLLVLPFPSIAYYTSLGSFVRAEGVEYANEMFTNSMSGMNLFSGITVHSQFLGPMLACSFAWLLCDMLIVERKFSLFHIILLFPIPLMSYMTRSRAAFLVLAVSLIMVFLYCIPKSSMPSKDRSRFSSVLLASVMVLIAFAIVGEVRNHAVTKWIRKTNEVTADQRSLGEAITASRQGKMHECISDFRKNTLLGTGFQVDKDMQARFESGQVSLFSAAIEKGLLPLMILGETGIVGCITFAVFLFMFYLGCCVKKYVATLTLFTVYMATNMAEATFFSPSGGGGVEWILMVVGGFVIDMHALADKEAEAKAKELQSCETINETEVPPGIDG